MTGSSSPLRLCLLPRLFFTISVLFSQVKYMEDILRGSSSNLQLCEAALRNLGSILQNEQELDLDNTIGYIDAALRNLAQARESLYVALSRAHNDLDTEPRPPPPQSLTFRNIVTAPGQTSINVLTETGWVIHEGGSTEARSLPRNGTFRADATGSEFDLNEATPQPCDNPYSRASPSHDDTIRTLARERLERQSAARSGATTNDTEVGDSGQKAQFILSAGEWESPKRWSLIGNPSTAELDIILKMWNEGLDPNKKSVQDRLSKRSTDLIPY